MHIKFVYYNVKLTGNPDKKMDLWPLLICGMKGIFHVDAPMAAKYPLPQRCQILWKLFLQVSNWFTAYKRGKVSKVW